jgi:hypothetical protein
MCFTRSSGTSDGTRTPRGSKRLPHRGDRQELELDAGLSTTGSGALRVARSWRAQFGQAKNRPVLSDGD